MGEKKEDIKKDENNETGKNDSVKMDYSTLTTGMLVLLILVVAFNQYQISGLYAIAGAIGTGTASASTGSGTQQTTQTGGSQIQLADILPTGTPAIYGAELGIKYDDISAANPTLANQVIAKLAAFDTQITLSGEELQRYIKIGSSISCEYCCGAKAIIFPNGQAACGCAHSFAMRGLAKYLLTKHGSEYTDDQILEELGKWKVLYFPAVHVQKAAALKAQGIELNYINLASNKYRGAEKGVTVDSSGSSQVGGC